MMQLGTLRGWRRVPWYVPGPAAAAERDSAQCASREEQREARQATLILVSNIPPRVEVVNTSDSRGVGGAEDALLA